MYVCMYVCMYVYVCIYVCMRARINDIRKMLCVWSYFLVRPQAYQHTA